MVMVKGQKPDISDLPEAERMAGKATDDLLGRPENDDEDLKTISGEICSLLCQCFAGDAMAILRGTLDCQGVLAWKRLHRTCSPRTTARDICLMAEVTSCGQVQDRNDGDVALTTWQGNSSAMSATRN